MNQCLRCGKYSDLSAIGLALSNFVCDVCRLDNNSWDVAHRPGGISGTLEAMEREMTSKFDETWEEI